MNQSELIETTCSVVAPAVSELNVGTIDRYGNVLPSIIVNSDTIFNWKARDFRDNYLSRLVAVNGTKEAAIDHLCDSLVSSGLIGKFPHLYPLIGDNATDNSLNLAYPFSKFSNEIRWVGSPIHGTGKVQGNGTTAYGYFPVSPYDMDPVNFSMGVFKLNTSITNLMVYEIGWGDSNNGAWIYISTNAAGGGLPSFNNNNYYQRLSYAPEANESGFFVGDVSSTKRQFLKNGIVKTQGITNLGLTRNAYGIFLLTIGPGGGYSPSSLGFAFLGESLSIQEHTDLNAIVQQFITEKGALII